MPTPPAPSHADEAAGLSRRDVVRRAGGLAAATAVVGTAAAATAAPAAAGTAVAARRTRRASARSTAAPGLPSARAAKAADVPLVDRDVTDLAALLQAGDISSAELTTAYLDRIKALNGPFGVYAGNGGYNAFVRIAEDEAMSQAQAADARLAAARRGGPKAPYLCGVPMGIKDSVGIAGRVSSNGSSAYGNNVANDDSTAVARLRAQGVVFLGHTTCSAFSGVIAGTFAGNAWDPAYVPGGSSQGSGCAPIARLAAACIGEETGGSIVWPAAINGASAIKPSLGLGSMRGVMPLSATYDVLGPIARSGRDAALIMNAILGRDPEGDPQTLAAPTPFPLLGMAPRVGSKPLKGLTIGIPQTDWMNRSTYDAGTNTITTTVVKASPQSVYDEDHRKAFDRVRAELTAMGATVKEFRGLDITAYGDGPDFLGENPYYLNPAVLGTIDGTVVQPRSAVVNASRAEIDYLPAVEAYAGTQSDADRTTLQNQYGRVPGGAATGTKTFEAQIAYDSGITAGMRREGERRRRLLIDQYRKTLSDAGVDVMLVMSIGQEVGKRNPANPSDGLPLRRYNQIANDLSWPMVSFPVGTTSNAGLPISVQLWGPRFSEPRITQAMVDYQARHPEHHTRFPKDPVFAAPRSRAATDAEERRTAAAPDDPASSNDPSATELAAAADRR